MQGDGFDKPIVLCGFMGCGKTTVGKLLSESLGMDFVDMDDYICEKRGMTVNEIFERYGEQGFREFEHEVCCELSRRRRVIIAAGGGALTFDRNVDVLHKAECLIVFLDVPFGVIADRIMSDNTRPLINIEDEEKKIEEMRRLYDKRYDAYMNAGDICLKCGGFSDKTAFELEKIIEKLAK